MQNGAFNSPNGFTLGDSNNGYSLDTSNGTKLIFSDFNLITDFAEGGALIATTESVPVPFEFTPQSGLAVFGTLWVGYKLKKKLKKQT